MPFLELADQYELKSESQAHGDGRIVIAGIIRWRLCAEIPPSGDRLLGSLLLQFTTCVLLAIPDGEGDIDKPTCRDLRIFVRMSGVEQPRKDNFPCAVGIDAFGFHVLVRLYLECAKALGIHVDAFVVFVLPIPNIDRAAFRSEEHTSELQSHHDLVCRLL